ncbi:MAG: TIR domain-containing protein [Candidatus Heimdallarchaeota archaeon]|nr:TIR domain-containing protein [Candidatus Heimdallarchaeota archaeon]
MDFKIGQMVMSEDEQLKLFLSWSGERSKLLAKELSKWFPKIFPSIETWMSEESISKGKRWYDEILNALKEYHIGIMCITPENYDAPWMVFEAGILHASSKKPLICPLLLGIEPEEIEGPLTNFQSTIFEKNDLFRLIKCLNEKLKENKINEEDLKAKFEKLWPHLRARVEEVSKTKIAADTESVSNVIRALSKSGFSKTAIGRHALFSTGFESHLFYTEALNLAKKRIYFLGRKNRKLFDKEHHDFFRKLNDKLRNGFDIKILFLDPEAPKTVLQSAHKDEDFPEQLSYCINKAKRVLKRNGIDFSICRKYQFHRTMELVVIDHAIAYSPILFDEKDRAKRMTKAPFTIINTESEYGNQLLQDFLVKWENAKIID